MMRFPLFIVILFGIGRAEAQVKNPPRKYPSLLWEISGNGLKKPSHLVGTMHVSSKLAFNLPDSFYRAIRLADVVALETNPETWQEDMSKYDIGQEGYDPQTAYAAYLSVPNDYFSIQTLKFYKYDVKVERALSSNPSAINSLLYRTYGNESSDFEEDTYLDMYIFQCGKKWGKRVTGVEDYGRSMQLMAEAYRDAARDRNRKERSYGDVDEAYSSDKLQEAYRTGNLDLLDSINRFNSESEAFDEIFLYRRNEIQAASIDSILRSGASLFVGVGAAHLPGDRGVIELLRKKGYHLRPVKMGERAGRDKDQVDRIRVPVSFRTVTADDGMYRVDVPGKLYPSGEEASLVQQQYADMSNGSYYMVTRILTNAWMWNHGTEEVFRTVDSLLYENIPGKIITKTPVSRNGYRGMDITNRTRRGDLQRYQFFITPFEIILFKISGNGDYIQKGPEAARFFSSIQLKEFRNGNGTAGGKKYSPPTGGFAVAFPHEPYTGNDGSWIWDAIDPANAVQYRVVRSDIHNFHFAEEDSFDLGLMEESFGASAFIDTQLQRKLFSFNGYPALDARYRDQSGGIYLTRFIIQGPHYYTLVAHGRQVTDAMQQFLQSFEFKPFVYGPARTERDTALYYSVTTPVFRNSNKIKLDMPRYAYAAADDEEVETEDDLLESGMYRNKTIQNDTTGEKVFVSFFRSPRYYYSKDSLALEKDNEQQFFGRDSSWIIRYQRKTSAPGNLKIWEVRVSDTGSSRVLWGKTWYRDGIGFSVATQTDTLTPPGAFVRGFFESFTPADTLKGINPFQKKSGLFFSDFFSGDSSLHQRAVKHIADIDLDSADLPQLERAISALNWKEKKYLDTKSSLVSKLGDLSSNAAADYLKNLYYALGDTVELQYTVLESLLAQRTAYAYSLFRDILVAEPPVLGIGNNSSTAYRYTSPYSDNDSEGGVFLDALGDSLALTKAILPDLLPLLNLDDYKFSIMDVLGRLVDSNLVQPADYGAYVGKFLIEAKQELKRQSILEKKKAITKAEEDKNKKKPAYPYAGDDEKDSGNDDLSLYATLLLPYWDKNPAIPPLIGQMLASDDKQLKYSTLLLLLRNGKTVPDSLTRYFAGLDEYRYPLYSDLNKIKKSALFPPSFCNHTALARSSLLQKKTYDKPDSLVYLDRLPAAWKGRTGFIYFFKYKSRKDDLNWKLAAAGMVPEDPGRFEFNDDKKTYLFTTGSLAGYQYDPWDFTGFTETKFSEKEPIAGQLQQLLKRMLYARRNSARNFYEGENDRSSYSYLD